MMPIARTIVAAMFAAVALSAAYAQDRVIEAPYDPQWSGVAQINNSVYGRCTGILLAPDIVVTAAHCLYSRRSGNFVRPQSVHVLFGYDRGDYGFHTTATRFEVAEGYEPDEPKRTLASDWAVLHLAVPVPDSFEPFVAATASDASGQVKAAGFAQDRREVLTVASSCTVQGRISESLIVTDCDVPHGYSGGPLIEAASGTVIGIQVARLSRDGRDLAVSIPIDAVEIDR